MKKYKIFAQKLNGEGPEQLGPFIIDGINKKDALDNAFHHIRNHLNHSGNYHLNVTGN